eukprot:365817-Chlamydomonas_euryale.AAC.35
MEVEPMRVQMPLPGACPPRCLSSQVLVARTAGASALGHRLKLQRCSLGRVCVCGSYNSGSSASAS